VLESSDIDLLAQRLKKNTRIDVIACPAAVIGEESGKIVLSSANVVDVIKPKPNTVGNQKSGLLISVTREECERLAIYKAQYKLMIALVGDSYAN